MDRFAFTHGIRTAILAASLSGFLFAGIGKAADAPDKGAIDWDKAKALYQREQQNEKLTPDEQAYLDKAKAARQGGQASGQGGQPAKGGDPIPADYRIGGFTIGPHVFSFRLFTLSEAIEKTEQAGGKVIELGSRQKFSNQRPEVFNHNAPDDLVQLVQAKLKQHGIKAVNYGVVPIPADEAGARKVFDFARKMKLPAVITESIDSLDMIEKLVKEYDIKVGIHQHARKPDYKLWDPHYVLDLVKNRDHRIGACADVGHWQTSGIRAIDGLRILEGRIVGLHLKERAALGPLGPENHDMVFGTGITDIAGILAELRRQKYDGDIGIEYEYNWQNNVPDIAQCIGFVRGWAAANPQ